MKYISHYSSDVPLSRQKLSIGTCSYEFPITFWVKRVNYYNQSRIESITLSDYKRPDNHIWGNCSIEFYSRKTIPHWDSVTEEVDRYTLEDFKSMIIEHNELVASGELKDYCHYDVKPHLLPN